jgi:meso-butanediol dehydrogenase / (S,S)-butanediol dehydrogenase / diacetyl reductase
MGTNPNHLQMLTSLDIPYLLKDKKIIVTGGGGAIGRATVLLLAGYGARVVAAGKNDEPLQQTRKEAKNKGLDIDTFVADVSDEQAVRSLIDFTVQTLGGLTTICNNAAVNLPGDVESVSAEDFRTSMDVNVAGPFYMAKHSIPHLREAGGGSIINTGSVNSVMAERQLSAYCTSKGAIVMLTRAIARHAHPRDSSRLCHRRNPRKLSQRGLCRHPVQPRPLRKARRRRSCHWLPH